MTSSFVFALLVFFLVPIRRIGVGFGVSTMVRGAHTRKRRAGLRAKNNKRHPTPGRCVASTPPAAPSPLSRDRVVSLGENASRRPFRARDCVKERGVVVTA